MHVNNKSINRSVIYRQHYIDHSASAMVSKIVAAHILQGKILSQQNYNYLKTETLPHHPCSRDRGHDHDHDYGLGPALAY